MRGRAGGFEASALVDRNVHNDAVGFHEAEHVAGDEFRGLGTGNEHGADKKVHGRQKVEQTGLARIKGVRGAHGDVEKAHPLEIDLEDGHIGAEAGAHAGGVDSGRAAADHDDLAGEDAGNAAEENAFSAGVLRQKISADEDRHAACDLAHGFEEREAVVHTHGLVGNAGRAGFLEGLGERFAGGEVEIGKEKLAFSKESVFLGERLLDLHD